MSDEMRTIETPLGVTDEMLRHILGTATGRFAIKDPDGSGGFRPAVAENHIEYWATVAGGDFDSVEIEEHGGDFGPDREKHTITLDTVLTGLTRLLSGEVEVDPRIVRTLFDAVRFGDMTALDPYEGDAVIQAGLFNDIRYG
tara:strand:+ start:6007 stop:6432 length:426 start_codon:yes stop_codon:yes gene_type:complete